MKRVNHLAVARGHGAWIAAILLALGLNHAAACPQCHRPPQYKAIDLGVLPDKTDTQVWRLAL
jgi:hypothetical protein